MKDNRIENLARAAQLLRQDETMAKLGLETESQLQKCIDAAVKKIDEGLGNDGQDLINKDEN
jgi:hypothetical protein